MEPLKAKYFVEAALEASIYVKPRDPGLTLDELNNIGARFLVRPGAIGDAVSEESDMIERPIETRVRLKPALVPRFNIHVHLEGTRRNEGVYEEIAHHIREHFDEHGKGSTKLSREQISRLGTDGHAVDVELALMELAGLVKLTAETVTVVPVGVNYFREFEGVGQRPPFHQHRPHIAEIYAEVEKAIRLRHPAPAEFPQQRDEIEAVARAWGVDLAVPGVGAPAGRDMRRTAARTADVGPLRWLHLSDLHVGCRGEAAWWHVLDQFWRSVDEHLKMVGAPDLVLLTGDLTFKGDPAEFDRLTKFLEKLLGCLPKGADGQPPWEA